MDGLGVEIERRPAPDRRPIEGLAVGRRPEPGVVARAGQVVAAERVEERPVGRVDHIADDLADALAVRVCRHLDHRRHDRRLDGDGEHPLDLGDGPLRNDARRRQAAGEPVAQDGLVGGHERRIRMQASQERLESLGRVRRLELGQLGQELLRASHLVDHTKLIEALVVLLDVQVGDDPEHVPGDPFLGRQPVGLDRGRVRAGLLHERPGLRPAGGSRIVESVCVAFVAIEGRGRRLEGEDRFPESFGERVDRRGIGIWQGHGWSPVGMAGALAPRRCCAR